MPSLRGGAPTEGRPYKSIESLREGKDYRRDLLETRLERALFHDLELEVNLFSARNGVQVLLPEFSDESQRWKTVIQVDQKLEAGQFPKIQDGYARRALPESYIGVEREDSALIGQVPKRVAVQMVAMREVSREVGIRPMRCYKSDNSSVASDSMELAHDGHRVADVLDNVAAYHFVELVVRKWIREIIEVVNNVSSCARVHIHADRARQLIGAATNIEDSRPGRSDCALNLVQLGIHILPKFKQTSPRSSLA